MRYVLAIDTAFAAITVAVLDLAENAVVERQVLSERGQAEQLVPMIDAVLRDAGIDYPQLHLIGVTVGPGSFTGVRVGLATARGLGLALNIPVQGIVTTDALYETWVTAGGAGARLIAINTKRDDLYVARYRGPQDVPFDATGIRIAAPDMIKEPVTGDGAIIIPGAAADIMLPTGGAVARLALRLYSDSGYTQQGRADPIYVRDAEVSVSKQTHRVPLDPQVFK